MMRFFVLMLGPILLIWASYCLTIGRSVANAAAQLREILPEVQNLGRNSWPSPSEALEPAVETAAGAETLSEPMAEAFRKAARSLATRLGPSFQVVVRSPYVLAGDVSEAVLLQHWEETIVPTTRALRLMYFDRDPDEPILIVLFSNEHSYRTAAAQFDRHKSADYHGYYIRNERRVMINATTGEGTLSHELTHALAHFDFPDMPEWFDEGLASLYEECDFSDDGLRLIGRSNWRINHLLHAMHHRRLVPLEALIQGREIRPDRVQIDYAQSRYLCLYLQERDLLTHFYRKFRANAGSDPTGLKTLRDLLGLPSLQSLDRDFRNWVIEFHEQAHASRP